MLVQLRAVGMQMNHPVVCSDWWGQIAEQVLEDEGLPYHTWTLEQLNKYIEGILNMAQGV